MKRRNVIDGYDITPPDPMGNPLWLDILIGVALLIAVICIFAGCNLTTAVNSILTNAPPSVVTPVISNVVPPAVVTNIGPVLGIAPPTVGKDYTVGISGKPAVCVTADGYPHVVAGNAGDSSAHFADWSGSDFTVTDVSVSPSSQFNNPCLSSDGTTLYASGIAYGGQMNMDLLAGKPGALKLVNARITQIPGDWDTGRSAYDSVKGLYVVASSDGDWTEFDSALNAKASGQLYVCCGGEKKAFDIQIGIWFFAISGFVSTQPGKSSSDSLFRSSLMNDAVSWAGCSAYPGMSSDTTYCEVRGNTNGQAIIVAAYNGVLANIWDGAKMLFPTTALLKIGSGDNGSIRFAPQIAVASNGWYVLWSDSGQVWYRLVTFAGEMPNDAVSIGSGSMIAGACDASGTLWCVWNGSGGMHVKGIRP